MSTGKAAGIAYWTVVILVVSLVLILEMDVQWLLIAALLAIGLASGFETILLFRKARYQRSVRDLAEYAEHQRYSASDLKSAMSAGGMLQGLSVQVSLNGVAEGEPKKKSPVSDANCLAYRVEAEIMEGLWKEAGQTRIIDSFWGAMAIRDGSECVNLSGPGILDTSGWVEKIVTLHTMKSSYPALADGLATVLGIFDEKETKGTRIRLREITLVPDEKIVVYGTAESGRNGLMISGSDEHGSSDSIFIRSERKPASSRFRRIIPQAIFMALLTLSSLFPGVSLAVKMLSKPGAALDFSQTGSIAVRPEGRTFRLRSGEQYWDFKSGETRDIVELYQNEELFTVDKTTVFTLEKTVSSQKKIRNGDLEYPRWDGGQWILTLDKNAGDKPLPEVIGGEGRLYVRNLTNGTFTMRVLEPDRSVSITTIWTFKPLEGADNPLGQWLNRKETGQVLVKADNFVELTTKTGAKRILKVGGAASWQNKKSWLLDVVPELLAGSGPVHVKNTGDILAHIRILGADGKPLYGDSPWAFDPKEGIDKNLGLALQSQDKDIQISGREEFIIDYIEFAPVATEALRELANFNDGTWTLDAGRYFGD